jgi:uncharacterized membrane protein
MYVYTIILASKTAGFTPGVSRQASIRDMAVCIYICIIYVYLIMSIIGIFICIHTIVLASETAGLHRKCIDKHL